LKPIEIITLKRIKEINGGKKNFGVGRCGGQVEKKEEGFLFQPRKEDHPKAGGNEDDFKKPDISYTIHQSHQPPPLSLIKNANRIQ